MDSKKARDSSNIRPAGHGNDEAKGQGLLGRIAYWMLVGASHINTAAELLAKQGGLQ